MRYRFERAEKLGMTVQQLEDTMSHSELLMWVALDGLRNEESAKAAREAERRARSRR